MKKIGYFFKTEKLLWLLLVLTSCSNDDDEQTFQPPEIAQLEVGAGSDHIAYIGSDLHIGAEVFADGQIETIEIEIYGDNTPWEFHHTYTEFSGQRNAHFHKHIDIPQEAEAGAYHFHFTVADQQGQTMSEEIQLSLLHIEDDIPPIINPSSVPEEGQLFEEGEQVILSGMVSDNTSLSSFLIVLVREEDQIPDEDITDTHSRVIVMEHTDHFDSPDFYEFEASIVVGAVYDNNIEPQPITGKNAWQSGRYYVLAIAEDVVGNKTFSAHFSIELVVE